MNIVFLVDFDGTVTLKDTCVQMTEEFFKGDCDDRGELLFEGSCRGINELWEKGELTTQECSEYILGKMSFTQEDLEDMLDRTEVDPYFGRFLLKCRERNITVKIVSDGYDFNIRYILDKYGWKDIEFYSNSLHFSGSGAVASFPLQDKVCKKCGNCKLNILKKEKEKGNRVAYVGDGHSDICPAPQARWVFAKGGLLEYCRDKDISCIPFESFKDIIQWMEELTDD